METASVLLAVPTTRSFTRLHTSLPPCSFNCTLPPRTFVVPLPQFACVRGGSNENGRSEKKKLYFCLLQNSHLFFNVVNMTRGAKYDRIYQQNNNFTTQIGFHTCYHFATSAVFSPISLIYAAHTRGLYIVMNCLSPVYR